VEIGGRHHRHAPDTFLVRPESFPAPGKDEIRGSEPSLASTQYPRWRSASHEHIQTRMEPIFKFALLQNVQISPNIAISTWNKYAKRLACRPIFFWSVLASNVAASRLDQSQLQRMHDLFAMTRVVDASHSADNRKALWCTRFRKRSTKAMLFKSLTEQCRSNISFEHCDGLRPVSFPAEKKLSGEQTHGGTLTTAESQ
jgi:hypothetical protein